MCWSLVKEFGISSGGVACKKYKTNPCVYYCNCIVRVKFGGKNGSRILLIDEKHSFWLGRYEAFKLKSLIKYVQRMTKMSVF